MTGYPRSSRPPRAGFTAAGEATSTGQAGSPAPEGDRSPARPGQPCQCGHVDVLHDISKTRQRTRCSASSGPNATRCGCKTFVAGTEPLNQENPS